MAPYYLGVIDLGERGGTTPSQRGHVLRRYALRLPDGSVSPSRFVNAVQAAVGYARVVAGLPALPPPGNYATGGGGGGGGGGGSGKLARSSGDERGARGLGATTVAAARPAAAGAGAGQEAGARAGAGAAQRSALWSKSPPPEWVWPHDDELLEVEAEVGGGVVRWVPAVVLQVTLTPSLSRI